MSPSNTAVASETRWQAVCQASDLVADSGVVVWHEGEQVALFYLPGQGQELYAVGNRDPRSGANIIGRGLVASLGATVVVAAPLYKQHFCLQNGNCLEDPTQRLPVWPVRIHGVTVELGQGLR
ncbi:nitrite reductase [Pseudomonas sp. 250J]|uniref:Nitrite reductase small subunit NirD n=1 Tax=Pseudomonas peradeniyensis TaxID=2745488 RepID=A0ABT2V5K1_9PSED|nr:MULTISPECIES: nitrite reductase small subunit NirD [Pseudomonas]KNX79890.1 nitrite reductase [Pseudomonas sp. 250J]MCU7236958.1 nitrite reductase small subunit NirD [Pseudomonas peradeniyensis]MCU7279824.1 nitrite reductase small subunit NirD [Pseudomonas peradeniyensis]QZA53451.1 nitrite reductase small subunit NirD [Pseudomonas sp. 2hn]